MHTYPSQPRRIAPENLERSLRFAQDSSVTYVPGPQDELGQAPLKIAADRVHDLLLPTMLGLLEDLTPGSGLMEEFLEEWERVQSFLSDPASLAFRSFGQWFYYPEDQRLVRFAPARWHRLALIVRNATLLSKPGAPLDWAAGRACLDDSVVAAAGCSVGSNILHSAVMLLRPRHAKVADVKDYHLNNGNRIRVTYRDFGRNKATVCAEQLHAVDPYLGVSVFSSGIDASNVERFVMGSPAHGEPKATVVVEETDDMPVKFLLRTFARAARVPLVMATDFGCAASIDVRRFDVDPNLSLAPGISDSALEALVKTCERGGELKDFVEAACAFSGRDELNSVPDFRQILTREIVTPFAGIPQLGSSAAMAGGMAAWAIAQIHLGAPVWERMMFNPATGQVACKGEKR